MNMLNFYEDLLELPTLQVNSVDNESRRIILHCTIKVNQSKCPVCLQKVTHIHQHKSHKVQDLSISGKEVWLVLRVPQFICKDCNRYFTHQADWLSEGNSFTKRQSKWIFELSKKQPFKETAALVNRDCKTVERIFYKVSKEHINIQERLSKVRKLGIDEVSYRKGKGNYACILTDLERGIVIDMLPSRKKEDLISYFQKLGDGFLNQIKEVSCDLWRVYIDVAESMFPNARVVIDRFHVVCLLNDILDKVRKSLRRKHPKDSEFKNIKWLLFKRKDKYSIEDTESLNKAFAKSKLLNKLYTLRNEFHDIFDLSPNREIAIDKMNSWIHKCGKLKNKRLNKFIDTLERNKEKIMNFIENKTSNAITEGLNNIVRYVKRISFGMPKFDHLKQRVIVISY